MKWGKKKSAYSLQRALWIATVLNHTGLKITWDPKVIFSSSRRKQSHSLPMAFGISPSKVYLAKIFTDMVKQSVCSRFTSNLFGLSLCYCLLTTEAASNGKCGCLSFAFYCSEKFNDEDTQALSLAHKIGHQPRRILEKMVALGLKDSERYVLSFLHAAFVIGRICSLWYFLFPVEEIKI